MTAYTDAVQPAPTESGHSAAGDDPGTVDPSGTPPESPAETGAPRRKTIPAAALYGCLGDGRSFDRQQFTPGLPLSAYAVVFKYADNYRPGPTIRLAVSELVYGTHYLTSDEEGWHSGTYSYHFYLRCGCCRQQSDKYQRLAEEQAWRSGPM